MNERIEKLAEQAGISYLSSVHPDMWKKFAELIVKECAMAALKLESTPDWYLDSVSVIPHHCSVNILKHFGVEE